MKALEERLSHIPEGQRVRLHAQIDRRISEQLRAFAKKHGKSLDEVIEAGILLAIQPSTSEQRLLSRFLAYLRTPDDVLTQYDRLDRAHMIKKLEMLKTTAKGE